MSDIYIAGVGMTKFGRHLERSYHDLTREAVSVYRSLSSTRPATLASSLGALGNALRDHGTVEEAMDAYQEAIDVFAEGGSQPLFAVPAKLELAALLEKTGEFDRAATLYVEVLETYETVYPADHPRPTEIRGRLERVRSPE